MDGDLTSGFDKRQRNGVPSVKTMRRIIVPAFLGSAALFANPALAAEDAFKFMPKGGREMFLEVLAGCANCDNIAALVTTPGTQQEWLKYFTGRQSSLKNPAGDRKTGALANLAENQAKTLISYLTANTPIPKEKLPKDTKKIDWTSLLPLDGRQLALEKCMGCHSIAVTVLNAADYRGWGMILRKSDHTATRLTDREAETLKHYLAINTPIPEDKIPPELKQSSGAY